MQLYQSFPPWIRHIFEFMGGCLGCCAEPPLRDTVEDPSKALKIQGQTTNKPSISEDFWSTSTCEMDKSAVQSQRSVSSKSTSNPLLDPHNSSCGTSNPTEFVNHGKCEIVNCSFLIYYLHNGYYMPSLLLWNQTRQQWTRNTGSHNRAQVLEPKLSWNATYDNLLGTNKRFPQPIPLPEMVDFLVDIWDQEGLYD